MIFRTGSEIGRMMVDKEGFKYIRYDAAGIEEQLLNLKEDTFENTHFTNDSRYFERLDTLRKAYENVWFN